MALRNRFGRFLKRGKKRKHRARRRGASRKHHRRVHHRRRRSNPHMLLANPSGSRQQLHLFGPRGETIRPQLINNIRNGIKRRRKRKGPKAAHHRRPRATHRRKHGRKYYRIYRGRGRSPKFRIFRRSNPFGAWMGYVRLGIAGGLGIVAARISGRLYTDHVSKLVLGATGAADPKSIRAILNEGLRIFAMGALPLVIEQHALRRLPMVTGADCMAFKLGAIAEAGRQGIGVAIKRFTKADAGKWGLDGEMPYVQYHQDEAGMIYGLHPSGQWYAIGRGQGMHGLMSANRFGAMSGVVQADEFGMGQAEGEYDEEDAGA